jgi:predicted nucleic acid-binding protein
MIHLDTSFLIRALVRHSPQDKLLREWLADKAPLAVSTVVWAEFLCGPVESLDVELAVDVFRERVPFVSDDAVLSAHLFNLSGRRRGSLMDCMIAATAIRAEAALATANPADFRRLESAGLRVVTG